MGLLFLLLTVPLSHCLEEISGRHGASGLYFRFYCSNKFVKSISIF